MERRKLFSDNRRRLFSTPQVDSPRRKLFSEDRILVCKDCGHEIHTSGISTNLICPNCGSSNRFNIKDDRKPRRSLFSSLTNRYPNPNGEGQSDKYGTMHSFECRDCHTKFEASSRIPQGVVCPNCGGLRVVQLDDVITDTEEQHEYSDATDELLKEFSGKTVTKESLQKLFTERGITDTIEDFCNSGYASLNDEGQICFSERPDLTRKFFSELVISVTKELHLVPTEGKIEELIHGLEERGNMSPRGLVLVKKAHGIIPPMVSSSQSEFSDTDSYIKDSGLENDLKLEYSGKSMPLKEFMDILRTQYNDAPDDLLDKLVDTGIIKIEGSQVEIL